MNWIRLSLQDASGPRDVLCPSCRDRAGQDPAEQPRPRPRCQRAGSPYLQEGEFEGVRLVQPGELQLRLVRAALALHLGAPRQRDIGLLCDQLQEGSGAQRSDPRVSPGPALPRLKILGGDKGLSESTGRCMRVCVPCHPQSCWSPGPPGPPPASTHIHIIAGPHIVGNDELGGEFGHETRRPVFSHHEDVLLGVRGEPRKVFNFLLGGQASRGVCGHSGAERRQPRARRPEPLPLTLTPHPPPPSPLEQATLSRRGVPIATEQVEARWQLVAVMRDRCRDSAESVSAPAAASSRQGSVSRLATQVLTQDEKQPREAPPGHSSCSIPAWPRLLQLFLRKVRSGEKKKKNKHKKEGEISRTPPFSGAAQDAKALCCGVAGRRDRESVWVCGEEGEEGRCRRS